MKKKTRRAGTSQRKAKVAKATRAPVAQVAKASVAKATKATVAKATKAKASAARATVPVAASVTLEAEAQRIAGATIRAGSASSAVAALGGARLRPGQLQSIPDLKLADLEQLFRLALLRACGGSDTSAKVILWRDADDELLLYTSQARLGTVARLVVVSIPIFTDQTGDAEVVVPFVTNEEDDPVGLIAATETRPRGPAAVIDVFGEELVAVAWAALVNATSSWASATGKQGVGVALAAAGFSATKAALRVSAQVRLDGGGE